MSRGPIEDGLISVAPRKTGERSQIPIHTALAGLLAGAGGAEQKKLARAAIVKFESGTKLSKTHDRTV